MDNNENFSFTFNFYGGNNQILPNATTGNQNFYGSVPEPDKAAENDVEDVLSPEAARLFVYINKVENLRVYLAQLAECADATELAKIIVGMVEKESKITPEEIVKERFISLFLPLAPRFVSGNSIDNIRARINTAWAKRPRNKK